MTTFQMSVIGAAQPDSSGDIYPSFLDVELSLGNLSPGHIMCYVMAYPTGADIGMEGAFTVPQNYAGSPVWYIKGVLDGAPSGTMAFGLQQVSVDDNESADVAYEAEDLASNAAWTHADEDMYEETITMTPSAAYLPGDTVFFRFFRDNSVDSTTINFDCTDVLFQYSDV